MSDSKPNTPPPGGPSGEESQPSALPVDAPPSAAVPPVEVRPDDAESKGSAPSTPSPSAHPQLAHATSSSSSSSSSNPPSTPGGSHLRAPSSAVGPPSSSPPAPSANPAFRRQLQSIRAADLEQEHTMWISSYTSEESFWLKQEERFSLLLKRAQVGANSSRDLLLYLKRSSKLLGGLSEQLTSLGSFGQTGETGSMRSACMAIDIVRKTTSSYLGELNARVFAESIRQAGQAAEEANRIATTVESAGSDMVKQLKAQRRATNQAWMQYYQHGQERAKCEQTNQKIKSDPFLLARQYEQELYALQTLEIKFQSLMASLLKDVQAEEAKRLQAMKLVLVDNLTAQKAVLEHSVKFTENALGTVRSVNPEQDLQEFVTAADLFLAPSSVGGAPGGAPHSASASSSSSSSGPNSASAAAESIASQPAAHSGPGAAHVESVLNAHAQTTQAAAELAKETPIVAFLAPPPPRDPFSLARVYAHEIEKEGSLSRQGAVFKSNWKPMHAILSSSGFLHLFEEKGKKSVHSTWNLSEATVESGEAVHPLAFALRFQKSGFSLSGSQTVVYFRADNSDELMEWTHFSTKHSVPQPTLTSVPHTEKDAATAAAAANGTRST